MKKEHAAPLFPGEYCDNCGARMTGDEAALNLKFISRQCREILCPVCLGEKLGMTSDDLHRAILVFRKQGCRLFSPLDD